MDTTEAARALAALRKMRQRECAQCKRPVEAFGKQRYCSDRCRWLAGYYRRKDRRAPRPQEQG